MGNYRILSIDGGGIRGILPAKLLERLHDDFKDLIEESDLITGNSAGSYLALGLADGREPKEMVQLLKESAADIFKSSNWMTLIKPKYKNKQLIAFADRIFGNKKLSDLKKRVIVPAFKVEDKKIGHWRPIFFHNFPGSETQDMYVKDVALSSSAAPTYFPSYRKMIDGGVFANNPSTLGVAFAVSEWGGHKDLEKIALLSLGTGFFPYQMTQKTAGWGDLQWLGVPLFYRQNSPHNPTEPLIDILLEGVANADVTLSQMLVRDRYFRLNPALQTKINLDDHKKIPDLIKLATRTNLTEVKKFIKEVYLKE